MLSAQRELALSFIAAQKLAKLNLEFSHVEAGPRISDVAWVR